MLNKFIHGDCIETMNNLDEGSVNLVLTSPPYNAEKEYENSLSLESYERFANEWVSCVPRILAPGGSLWLNVGYTKISGTETLPLTYLYYPIVKKYGLHMIQEIVWHYEGGMSYKKRYTHRTERWMWLVKDPNDFVFNLDDVRDMSLNRTVDKRNHPLGKNPTDYWYFNRVVGGTGAGSQKTIHPCQFPVPMLDRIIKASSKEGDTVLDPFGGSGSTAVAAHKNRRGFLSVELDPNYHAAAQKRFEDFFYPLGR